MVKIVGVVIPIFLASIRTGRCIPQCACELKRQVDNTCCLTFGKCCNDAGNMVEEPDKNAPYVYIIPRHWIPYVADVTDIKNMQMLYDSRGNESPPVLFIIPPGPNWRP